MLHCNIIHVFCHFGKQFISLYAYKLCMSLICTSALCGISRNTECHIKPDFQGKFCSKWKFAFAASSSGRNTQHSPAWTLEI